MKIYNILCVLVLFLASCSDVPIPPVFEDMQVKLSSNPAVNFTTLLVNSLEERHFPITIEMINGEGDVILSDSILYEAGNYTIDLREEKEGKLYVVAVSQLETFTYDLIKLAE
jgi:hypothetical protein